METMVINKTCSCGCQYFVIPKDAVLDLEGICPGWYFNCTCKSTLYVPVKE